MEDRVRSLETSVLDIKGNIAFIKAQSENTSKSLAKMEQMLEKLTELQISQENHRAEIRNMQKEINVLFQKSSKYDQYTNETGCPLLKAANSEARRQVERIEDVEKKMGEIYPVTSRAVKIADNMVFKIVTTAGMVWLAVMFSGKW